MSDVRSRLEHLLEHPETPGIEQAVREVLDELDRLREEGSPGVLHKIDQAFYDLTVKERDYERQRVNRLESELDLVRQVTEEQLDKALATFIVTMQRTGTTREGLRAVLGEER